MPAVAGVRRTGAVEQRVQLRGRVGDGDAGDLAGGGGVLRLAGVGALGGEALLVLALAAYATYVVNAGQFLLKLRAARLEGGPGRAPRLTEALS